MRRATHQSGMTLVESMASMGILLIGIAGALAVTVDSSRSANRGAHVEQASMLGQSLMSGLMSVPWTAQGSGGASLFANTSTSNDADIVDNAGVFTQSVLPVGSYDHAESEIAGTPTAAMVAPLPTDTPKFERYWNIAPIAGTNGVVIAVIVRWQENQNWYRLALVGSRYQP
jgi:prepilin-type N-terminal cleavage/methylation domain-containing protein